MSKVAEKPVVEKTISDLLKLLCENKKRALALKIVSAISEIEDDYIPSKNGGGCGQPSAEDILDIMLDPGI